MHFRLEPTIRVSPASLLREESFKDEFAELNLTLFNYSYHLLKMMKHYRKEDRKDFTGAGETTLG